GPCLTNDLGCGLYRGLDLLRACCNETRRGFKRIDGSPQQFVDKFAQRLGRNRERLFRFGRRPPAEPVFPHEAEGTAQKQLKGGRRLRAAERARNGRMVGAESAIMGGHAAQMPVPPALQCRPDTVERGRLLRTRHQSIRLAERMFGNARTCECTLLRPGRNQRTCAEPVSLRVAAAARYRQGAARTADNDRKATSIGL